MKKNLVLFFAAAFFSLSLWAADQMKYKVREGETLSHVALKIPGKIYGKNGSLERLLHFNPQIKNPNFVLAGAEILLVPRAPASVENEPSPPVAAVPEVAAPASAPAPASPAVPTTPVVASPPPKAALATPKPDSYSLLEIAPVFSFSAIEGTQVSNGSKAILPSALNTGVSASWRQVWSPKIESVVRLGVAKEKYPSSSTSLVYNQSLNVANFGLGLRRNFSHFWLEGDAGVAQKVYYHGVTSGPGVELETIAVPVYSLTLGSRLAEKGSLFFDVQGSAIRTGSGSAANYQAKAGQGYRGDLILGQSFKTMTVTSGLFYQSLQQDSAILQIRRRDVGLVLSVLWRFE